MRISSVQVKRHQLLVIFETKKSAFLQILHHSSVSWERTPLYFLAATLYIFNKRSLSKYTFGETWYEQSKVWNLHFDGFLLSKSFKVSAEKVKKSYFSWHWRVMQSLKKNLFVASNMAQGIWWIFFDGLFLSKICKVWATKIQRSYLSRTEQWWKIWINAFGFKNGMRNWMNFHWSTQKSEKLKFDGPFLSKASNISARKFHRNYVPLHWRAMQNLKVNYWLVAWKMTQHKEFG